MKTTSIRFAAVLAFATCAVLSVSALTGFDPDYDAARERAKANGKLMLLYFTGSDRCGFCKGNSDSCTWCKRLESEVFSQPEFLSSATNEFELVVIDLPHDKTKLTEDQRERNLDLAYCKFKIRFFQMVMVIDARDESVVCETAYIKGGAAKWLENLHKNLHNKTRLDALDWARKEMVSILERKSEATDGLWPITSKEAPLTKDDKEKLDAFQKTRMGYIQDYKKLAEKVKAAKIPEELEWERRYILARLKEYIDDKGTDGLIKSIVEYRGLFEEERGKGQKQEERKP